MFRATGSRIALAFVCLSANAPAPADTVVLTAKEPFRNVTITDVRRGRIHFRGVSGETLQKPLGLVTAVSVEALPQLAVADEARAAGDFDGALAVLAECEKEVREPWQRTLARYRRLAVLSSAGRTDQALAAFLELVREDPQAPVENLPSDIGPAGCSANRAALALLRKTNLRGISPALEQVLAIRRLELTLLEDPDAARNEFRPADDSAPARIASSQPSDEVDAPLLFGTPRSAPTAGPTEIPRESPLRRETDRLRNAGDARGALGLLERAMPFVRKSDRGWWTVDAARCRIELREYARAADELLAVAAAADRPAESAGTPASASPAMDRALAAKALYYVGLAHEGLNRPDVAADQYRELRSREDLPADLRAEVEAALERLRAK
jgi:tetratricopeptide (TPR) repeat protein